MIFIGGRPIRKDEDRTKDPLFGPYIEYIYGGRGPIAAFVQVGIGFFVYEFVKIMFVIDEIAKPPFQVENIVHEYKFGAYMS